MTERRRPRALLSGTHSSLFADSYQKHEGMTVKELGMAFTVATTSPLSVVVSALGSGAFEQPAITSAAVPISARIAVFTSTTLCILHFSMMAAGLSYSTA